MRKNERRANHTIIAHSVDSTFIHQDVHEAAQEIFFLRFQPLCLVYWCWAGWGWPGCCCLLHNVERRSIVAGTCPSPSLRQRVLSCHYNIAASSHCPYSHWNLHSVCTGSTSHALHGTWRLEGFDTGFQTGFIMIHAMIWPEQRRWKFGGWHNT